MLSNNDIEKLFRSHYVPMYRVAAMILHDDDMAHDIVHDVFAMLMDNPVDRDVDGGYLVRCVRNRCLNHIRNIENRERIHNLYLLEVDRYEDNVWTDTDEMDNLCRLIDEVLPEQCRNVVTMYYRNGMRTADIAERLEISVSAVHKSLNRAFNIIRKNLKGNG